ncbi:MAG: hypothetical protein ACD_79C01270G0004 [uncultured bacterium]|nr:MAG: hypothetical protein ACD_79C01270G0004 [uncultured bacterium]
MRLEKMLVLVRVLFLMAFINYLSNLYAVDLSINTNVYSPESEILKDGFGFETKVKFWENEYIGVGIGVGAENWNIEPYDYSFYSSSYAFDLSIDGDLSLFTIGPSIFIKAPTGQKVNFIFETGLRYVSVSSDIQATIYERETYYSYYGGYMSYYTYDTATIDVEDSITGVINIDVEIELGNRFALNFGGGYQYDIKKGDVSIYDHKLGESELKAFKFNAGVVCKF